MATLENVGRIAFGQFEVDLQSGEIWKAGFRVRLQEQPFKVLIALLAKPGLVVTRSELHMQVWGPETNVDFDRALAVAIKKVREALSDSAENPRFVETLAKRGYRFIAPVSMTPVAAASLPTERPEELRSTRSIHAQDTFQLAAQTFSPPVFPVDPGTYIGLGPGGIGALNSDKPAPAKARAWRTFETALVLTLLAVLGLAAALSLRSRSPALPPVPVVQLTHNSLISAGPPSMESLLTLVTDGDRVLTSMQVAGKVQLAAIDVSTGELQPLKVPGELANATVADISRDGSHLLLKGHLSSQSEQPFWIVPTAGGSALRIGNITAQAATWMPDGTNILIATGNELKIVRSDSGTVTPYMQLPGRAFWLRWSPDGRLLRFTLMDTATHVSSIWELESGSKTARPLLGKLTSHAFECCGTWTADGKAYVFQVSASRSSNLWEVQGDGRKAEISELTNGPLSYFSPVASRSGQQIFFYGSDPPLGLQRFDGPRPGFRPEPLFLADATRVDFSHDGKWVAWTEGGRLWRARAADGADRIQLAPDYLEVFMAHWSPDGSRLALMARAPGEAWQIYLVSEDGGKLERLFKDARNAADPGWSADGQQLVYGREPDVMGKDDASHVIAIFNLKNHTTQPLPGSEGLFSPRWSPDGNWIAALSLDQQKVMLFNVATRGWKELASTSAADPVWSRDSKAVYVHAFMSEGQPILRIAVPGGDMQFVAGTADFHSGEPANYFFGGLTPEDAPLVQPRVGTGNLYRLDLDRR